MGKPNLHLSNFKLNLIADERKSVPSLRTIKVFSELDDKRVIAYFKIDERLYNTFTGIDESGIITYDNQVLNFIRKEFYLFKKSNPNYGDFEDGGDKLYGYQGSDPLYVEDFFNYLKSKNRDLLISNILQDEKK